MTRKPLLVAALALVLALAGIGAAGCGGSSSSSSSPSSSAGGQSKPSDAASAATGDIPDNQVFLTYKNTGAGYSVRYPEGWTQQGSGKSVLFRDKDNTIRIAVASGAAPTAASVQAALTKLKAAQPTLKVTAAPKPVPLKHGSALKVTYSVQGSPNAVTGKRPLLLVDRYVYAKGGKVATVDLGTPKGVDNVDAYRMISQSFAWR